MLKAREMLRWGGGGSPQPCRRYILCCRRRDNPRKQKQKQKEWGQEGTPMLKASEMLRGAKAPSHAEGTSGSEMI